MAIPPELMASASEVTKLSKLSTYRGGGHSKRVAWKFLSQPRSESLTKSCGAAPIGASLIAASRAWTVAISSTARDSLTGTSLTSRPAVIGTILTISPMHGGRRRESSEKLAPLVPQDRGGETPAAMRFGSAMRWRRGHGVGFRGAVQASGVR
jgi:hypothetical protein